MNIPFLDLLKKAKERFLTATTPAPAAPMRRIVPVEKSSGQKLSKPVLPNTTRSSARVDPFQAAASASGGRAPATTRSRATGPGRLPPVVALAIAPQVERAISLPLSDVLAQVPQGYVKPPETFDGNRAVLLK